MKKELEDFPKEKLSRLNDYFDGEERRSQKQNGENINWLEMSENEHQEIINLKLSYGYFLYSKSMGEKVFEEDIDFSFNKKLTEEEEKEQDEDFFLEH